MGFLDDAKKFGGAALEKGKDLAQITKLNVEISTLQSKIEFSKQTIGNIVVAKGLKLKDEEVEAEIEKINGFNTEIDAKKTQIEELEAKTKA